MYIDDEEEEEEEEFVVHTRPFKVMGVVYKTERQNHLKAACMKMQDDANFVVKAMIEPDPDNDFDANAIRVLIDYGTGFKHVGFIAEELTKYVHPVLNSTECICISDKVPHPVGKIRVLHDIVFILQR